MLQSNTRAAVAATYPNKSIAEACLRDLKNAGFHGAWMAVTKSDPGDAENATAQPSQPAAPHMVAESSDGVAGTLGRYFSGESSLRHSLVERGLSEADAREVDASLPAEGAVVVAQGGERVDEAASILARGASRVFGAEGERFARYPSTTDTVPGQGDELDRGSDRNRSGGGLGATTGFWNESDARKDMRANEIGELGDDTPAQIAVDSVYYERRARGDRG